MIITFFINRNHPSFIIGLQHAQTISGKNPVSYTHLDVYKRQIVGRVWNNKYRHAGNTYEIGQHGFARDMDFKLTYKEDKEMCIRDSP